jgi:ubiquinone/menaquinone biosynthesis C-methylase UbiE
MNPRQAESLIWHLQSYSKLRETPDRPAILMCDIEETPLERRVRHFYEAQPYHRQYPQQDLETRIERLQQDWAHWVIPLTLEGKRTLDVGCGCGLNLVLHGALAAVAVGIDLSLNALRQARKYAIEQGVSERMFLVRADISRLALPTGSFDLITCVGVLHHIPDHVAALANMARLLDESGVLMLGLYHPGGRFGHRLKRWVLSACLGPSTERRVRWARRLFNVRKEAQKYHIPEDIYTRDAYAVPVEKAFSVKRLAHELKQVGLIPLQVRPSPAIPFPPDVAERAQRRVRQDGQVVPIDTSAVDRALTGARRHHYWCLAQKLEGERRTIR